MRLSIRLAIPGIALALPFAWSAPVQSQQTSSVKSDLRVLLVGHDPAAPYINYEPTERMLELHGERTGAFEALLRVHFQHVTVVYANDYEVGMSDLVDVTLFDATPKTLESGATDNSSKHRLPAGFSKPALMVAEVASDIGGPLQLKLDWL